MQEPPIAKSVVLVGAGNAHLQLVRRFGMSPLPGVAFTLINPKPYVYYSAMVPACLAGDYSREQITIDLTKLCRWANVRLIREPIDAIDPENQQVSFSNRPRVGYDVLSIGLGSVAALPEGCKPDESCYQLRPLGALLEALDQLEVELRSGSKILHLAVVGGGASGCELALAIRKRLREHSRLKITLLQSAKKILPGFPSSVSRHFESRLKAEDIALRTGSRVSSYEQGRLRLHTGELLEVDRTLWATHASPPLALARSGLARDERGFLQVNAHLQSLSHASVFGTGDCISFQPMKTLPKNGVHAVRQGRVLFENIALFLREVSLKPFRPQRYCLCLLNTADNQAVASYGPLTYKGRWVRRWKDRIDRAWLRKHCDLAPSAMSGAGEEALPIMSCGGCGSKVSSDILSAALRRLDIGEDSRILMGCRSGEDAAVFRTSPSLFGPDAEQLVEVQTVDHFKSFIDDPYLFGRIAAIHSLSDLHAMNARPFAALAIASLPPARGPIQENLLVELLTGAVEELRLAGATLSGGHTTEGSELALGFCVTGHAEAGRVFKKSGLREGDLLILTKAIGTGAILAAWMRGSCQSAWLDAALASMLQSNMAVAKILEAANAMACTDVTGFGLAGHLLEMLRASGVKARLRGSSVPLLPGFEQVIALGIRSTLHEGNAKSACLVGGDLSLAPWLFDPQTSGGLLAGIRPDLAQEVLGRLHDKGFHSAAIVGEVLPASGDRPTLEVFA